MDNAHDVRIVRVRPDGRQPANEAPPTTSIFIGAVDTQTIVPDDWGRDFRLIEVHFMAGARNRRHTHTTDQILVVTEGTAIVATASVSHELGVGDVAFIPAGEEHWHGAKPGHDMTHLAINGNGSETKITE